MPRFHLTVILMVCSCLAGVDTCAQVLLPMRANGKMGFINEAGQVVVPIENDSVGSAAQGYFTVIADKKYKLVKSGSGFALDGEFDFIHTTSTGPFLLEKDSLTGFFFPKSGTSISPRYQSAECFAVSPKHYVVEKNAKYGVVTFKGEEAIPCAYSGISRTDWRKFIAKETNGITLFDSSGKKILSGPWSRVKEPYIDLFLVIHSKSGLWGASDAAGQILMQEKYDSLEAITLNTFRFFVRGKTGLARNDKEILPANYERINVTTSGWIIAWDGVTVSAFSSEGKQVLAPGTWKNISEFSPECFRVTSAEGLDGIVTAKGHALIRPDWKTISAWGKGFLCTGQEGSRYFSASGRESAPLDYIEKFQGNLAVFRSGEKIGILHENAVTVVAPKFDAIRLYASAGAAATRTGTNEWAMMYFNEDGSISDMPRIIVDKSNMTEYAAATSALSQSGSVSVQVPTQENVLPEETDYEWFVGMPGYKYGLRNKITQAIVIPPKFNSAQIIPRTRLAVASSENHERKTVHTIVSMRTGKVITPVPGAIYTTEFTDSSGYVSRFISSKGGFHLINRNGFITKTALTYIGPAYKGYAPANMEGKYAVSHYSGDGLVDSWTEQENGRSVKKYATVKGGLWGIMTQSGTWKLPPKYDRISPFSKGIAVYKKGIYSGLIDTSGREITPPHFRSLSPASHSQFYIGEREDALFSFADSVGRQVSLAKFDATRQFSEGLCAVKQGNLWGYIGTDGNFVLSIQYQDAGDFHDGKARVKLNNAWVYIEKAGAVVSPGKYSRAGDFYQGTTWVQEKGRFRFVNAAYEPVHEGPFTEVSNFVNGLAVVNMAGSRGAINPAGEIIIPARYDAVKPFEGGLFECRKNGQSGIALANGELLIPLKYEVIKPGGDGFFMARRGGLWTFLTPQGEEIHKPEFAVASKFSEGRAAVKLEGLWGYIGTDGGFILEPAYILAGDFRNGHASVRTSKGYEVIDQSGEQVYSVYSGSPGECGKGVVFVRNSTDKLWSLISFARKEVSPQKFLKQGPFINGQALVQTSEGYWMYIREDGSRVNGIASSAEIRFSEGITAVRKSKSYCLLNHKGEEVLPAHFDSIEEYSGYFRVVYNGDWGYLRKDLSWLYPIQEYETRKW